MYVMYVMYGMYGVYIYIYILVCMYVRVYVCNVM